ncbi:MAG TPA: hypothetical protein VHO25_20255, partial [Polyangiaceae bacterium]|nr:hypothetical protein [Polyangiaceae bacterium]
MLIWVWPSAYLAFTVDDAFYYLQTARNIARGFGATFDRFEPTDGFHPLWCYSLAAVLWLLDKIGVGDTATAVRLVLSLQALLILAAGYGLSRAGKRGDLPQGMALGLAALLAAFYGAKILINGQESALQFTLLALVLIVLARRQAHTQSSAQSALVLGVICGLVALARLEATLFGLACIVGLASHGPPSRAVRRRDALLAFTTFAAVSAPYWIAHYLETGHWVPVSGVIKAERVQGLSFPALTGLAIVLALAVWLWRNIKTRPGVRLLLPLWIYVLGLQGYLAVVRGELVPEIWYCAPHALLLVAHGAQTLATKGWPLWTGASRRVLAFSAALLVSATWVYRALPSSHARYQTAAELGPWIDEHLPPDARVASWDAGILAAHTAHSVTNLDGLVNSWQFKLRYLDTGAVDQYQRERSIDYLVQYVPLAWLQRGALRWNGVALGDWHVLEARSFELRRVSRFWQTELNVYLVLTRHGTKPRLSE